MSWLLWIVGVVLYGGGCCWIGYRLGEVVGELHGYRDAMEDFGKQRAEDISSFHPYLAEDENGQG